MQSDPSRPATGYPAHTFHHQNGGQPPPGAIAYPYAAYPQQQYYNPPARSSRSFFRAFFAAMICLTVLFGVILIVTWLVLRPSLPHFTVHSLSLSNLSTTAQSISATWQLSFLVRNGNKKMTITYNALRSSVFYRSNYIAESQLPPFRQDTKSDTTLNLTLTASSAYLPPSLIDALNSEKTAPSIPFDVQILASTSFRSAAWRFRTRLLKVLCRKLPFAISSNTNSTILPAADRQCQVWT
ncbi:hypothetical protein VNO78_36773 [Psophocarpus tetragonolobus]|uniref:Late embryogenesis abundant protein LEA-2 subgroup domain-containing protein n=1 Tax=Psophocarpus tetragonolobus TaxID=3891 RepID=A0AAN9NDK7_PSOTE